MERLLPVTVSLARNEEPEGKGGYVWLLATPPEACPFLEICLLETAFAYRPALILDARRRVGRTLLERADLQDQLQFSYERPPAEWQKGRAFPYLFTQFVKSILRAWPRGLPRRLLLVHETEDTWWIEILVEHVRVECRGLQWARVTTETGTHTGFCFPYRCPFWKAVFPH